MKPVDYALFNGYMAGLYNAGFRAQTEAQAKLHDALVNLNFSRAGGAPGPKI